MAVERDAVCPACSGVRRIKAQPGVTISCLDCGRKFRAPALPPATETAPVHTDEGPSTPPVRTGEPSPVPTSAAKVRQNARPRARGVVKPVIGQADDAAPAPELQREPLDPVPQHPLTEAGKRHGRRGGMATTLYRSRVLGR